MIIAVSGSVGTGKTAMAKELAKKIHARYIDVNELILKHNLRGKYLAKLDTYEINTSKLVNFLVNLVAFSKRHLVIDSHLSHFLPSKYADYCVICKCDIKTLEKRLKLRGYKNLKIRENLDSEIFDVCLVEALENKHEVIVVDTTKRKVSDCVKEILEKIK